WSGKYSLDPNPDRHDESPLAVAISDWFTERSC
ncbi:replication initiation protein, partial [Chimaeribacter arupi]